MTLNKPNQERLRNYDLVKTAVISPCQQYRYILKRIWDLSKPALYLIMLNPSTADAIEDDPTINRGIEFAFREGCGSLVVINLFAWRATDPKNLPADMKTAIGPDNMNYLDEILRDRKENDLFVVAWGAESKTRDFNYSTRYVEVFIKAQVPLWCFGKTKYGYPKHPLYLGANTPLERYKHVY